MKKKFFLLEAEYVNILNLVLPQMAELHISYGYNWTADSAYSKNDSRYQSYQSYSICQFNNQTIIPHHLNDTGIFIFVIKMKN